MDTAPDMGRGDSRLRGNDGRGGREWGNAKAQGRNEKQAGMTTAED